MVYKRPILSDYYWSIKNHKKLPEEMQKNIKAILMYCKKENLLSLIPNDLWLSIFSHYNYKEKYEEDQIEYYNKKLEYIHKYYKNNSYENYMYYGDILRYYYNYEEAKEHILILNNCNCCMRHTFNRPQKIMRNYKEIVITDPGFKLKKNNCSCICRQYIRYLNRVFCEKHEYYYPEQTEQDICEI